MPGARPPAILLMGPTGTGKTSLALALAARLPVALISVDSALVYRGLDIGTAKPSPETLARVAHRLIDICDPAEVYSAARFRADALAAMAEIVASGQVPLLVGGTMLYFRALRHGLAALPDADPSVRRMLEEHATREGVAYLHAWLARVDPVAAQRIHPQDPQRVQRALEVYLLTGQPMSQLWTATTDSSWPYACLTLVVAPRQRDWLRARLAERFDAMLAAGFQAEVERLLARGDLHAGLPALRAVGYRQMVQYLQGQQRFEDMRLRAIVATRQLAKRQMTWLRRETEAIWLDAEQLTPDVSIRRIEAWLAARAG